ncbi:hypothetical protein T310_10279, partial [Rasamsonia emersonii CBS 393.64]
TRSRGRTSGPEQPDARAERQARGLQRERAQVDPGGAPRVRRHLLVQDPDHLDQREQEDDAGPEPALRREAAGRLGRGDAGGHVAEPEADRVRARDRAHEAGHEAAQEEDVLRRRDRGQGPRLDPDAVAVQGRDHGAGPEHCQEQAGAGEEQAEQAHDQRQLREVRAAHQVVRSRLQHPQPEHRGADGLARDHRRLLLD